MMGHVVRCFRESSNPPQIRQGVFRSWNRLCVGHPFKMTSRKVHKIRGCSLRGVRIALNLAKLWLVGKDQRLYRFCRILFRLVWLVNVILSSGYMAEWRLFVAGRVGYESLS